MAIKFLDKTGTIRGVQLKNLGVNIETPNIGFTKIFAKADGLYYIGSNGIAIGPLSVSGASLPHATSHKHGGVDEVATATPTANAIPKADASGRLNTWVTEATPSKHASTHKNGGGDEIATATAGPYLIPKAESSGKINGDWIPESYNFVWSGVQEFVATFLTTDQSSHPTSPSSGKSKWYSRNGAPYIKRSTGGIHPLVQGDELLKELPYAQIWGGTRYLNGVGWKIIDLNGGENHLSPAGGCYCETQAVQLGSARAFATNQLDGTTGYAAITNAANLIITTNGYLAGGWFKLSSLNRGHGLIQAGHTTQTFELYINSGNAVAFRSYHGTTGYASVATVSTTGWHFIVGQSYWSSSSNWVERLFLDGTWYNYSGAAPTVTSRTAVGDFRVGLAYNNSLYLAGDFYRVFNTYISGHAPSIIEEYYGVTKNCFQ